MIKTLYRKEIVMKIINDMDNETTIKTDFVQDI